MRGKRVNLFVCGITPYDFSHIGHARTYISFDMIVKYLRKRGFNVFYLQNVTDVDNKIIYQARAMKMRPEKVAEYFKKEYLKDMKALKVSSVSKYARATEHIKEIISQVKRLLEKSFAYQIEDGIYYDISKFKNYGKLSRRTVLQAQDAVSRIDEGKEKKNKGDFCLWKLVKRGNKELVWPSPFGPGRPGWHIEDTAITEKYFGPRYDIHGGARDLIFPHHEAEISQMEAVSGKSPMVRYWLHTGFLTVEGVKMAKSLKNFVTIKDFVELYSARILRFFVLKFHYRSPIDYSKKAVWETKKELERIDEFIEKIQIPKPKFQTNSNFQISKFQKGLETAMEDDFNTPKALAVIFDLVNRGNSLIAKDKLSKKSAKDILNFLREIDKVFNFIFWLRPKEKIPKALLNLVKQRQLYREKGNWQKADQIRKKIQQLGWQIEDTKQGPKIKTYRARGSVSSKEK